MGYGLGAALGAKTGSPDKTVVNIAGDGCFRMNMNEIATATRHNIPVIQVVINNSCTWYGTPVAESVLWSSVIQQLY